MVRVPSQLTEASFIRALSRPNSWVAKLLMAKTPEFVAWDNLEWVEPGGLLALIHVMHETDARSSLLPPKVLPYLQRMRVARILGLSEDHTFTEHPPDGRFIPAVFIRSQGEIEPVIEGIKEILDHSLLALGVRWAAAWSINELLGNVLVHAEARDGGLIFAQVFPTRGLVQIAVSDMGIGIGESVRQADSHWQGSDVQALELALTRGWSSKKGHDGSGYGLYLMQRIVENQGITSRMIVVSGQALVRIEQKQRRFTATACRWPGTFISMTMDLKAKIDMQDIVGEDFLDDDTWEVEE